MKFSRIILALLVMSCGASMTYADDGAIGGICRVGEPCNNFPGGPGNGGIDPSPYDPPREAPPGYPGQPGYPGYPNQPPQPRDRKEVYLGQYFRDQDVNLLSLFNMNVWNDRGLQIESVEVMTQPGDRVSLSLLADGYLVASQNYPSYYVTLTPNRALILGETLRSQLSLAVRGKLYIERVAVNFRRSYNPPYPPNPGQDQIVLQGSVYQSFYGPGSIDINRITNLGAYRGYRLADVIVNGRSLNMNGQSSAQLLVNGMIEGQLYFYSYEQGQTIRPYRSYVVGQNLNSVTLNVSGNVSVSTIQVRLTRY